jgi:hypothetical protein
LRVLVVVAVVGLVLSASACGGGKKSPEASAAEQWASSVCNAFTDWKTSLEDAKATVTSGGLSGANLRRAARQAQDATQKLSRTLKNLGAPSTTGGAQAKSNLSDLEASLSESASTIESTLSRGQPSIEELTTVAGEFASMKSDLTAAVRNLKQFDPSGELEKAFHDTPSCSAYFAS